MSDPCEQEINDFSDAVDDFSEALREEESAIWVEAYSCFNEASVACIVAKRDLVKKIEKADKAMKESRKKMEEMAECTHKNYFK